jgi:hypothetical protein
VSIIIKDTIFFDGGAQLTRNKYAANVCVITLSLAFFLAFPFLADQILLKQLGLELGVRSAFAGGLYDNMVDPQAVTPPSNAATDNSAPSGIVKYAWSKLAGREDMVFLNMPSNQGSNKVMLPDAPSGVILAKYDPMSNMGQLALMHMAQVGPNIKAEIIQLTPQNFHHFMGSHFKNFAWLDFNSSVAGCDSSKYLSSNVSPQVDNTQIMQQFSAYDSGMSSSVPTFGSFSSAQQAAINQSNLYWHQRLHDPSDPCFTPVSFKQFDDGKADGNWINLSEVGFFNLVALAQQVHKCAISISAVAGIQSQVHQTTSSSAMGLRKHVTTTVNYLVVPQYYVGSRSYNGTYYDFQANPTWVPSNDVSFISVQGQGQNVTTGFDTTGYQLPYYQQQTQSGWSGLFCFLAIIVVFALSGIGLGELLGADVLNLVQGIGLDLAGGVGGGIGLGAALITTGGNPATPTADITPFVDSSYSLTQQALAKMSTPDQVQIQGQTDQLWLSPNMGSTPGGFQTVVTALDLRKPLSCGGPSGDCVAPIVSQIGMGDSQFEKVINSMFRQPTKILENNAYPYSAE